MKRLLFSVAAATTLSFVLPAPSLIAEDKPASEMAESMEKISSAFRRVRRMVNSPESNAQVLELLATMRAEAVAAAKHKPMMTADIPEASRAKFVEDFNARMSEFIAAIEKTEAAIKAGNNAAAATLVSDMAAMQKAGHKDFKKDDKK